MSKELEALERLGEKERITGTKHACYLVSKIKNDEEYEIIKEGLKQKEIYFKALCDIESGEDVRKVLERTLT